MHLFIEDYLNDYIASQDFDYAMMLTGEWGSGKTYFVEEQGKALLEYIDSPLYKKERSQKVDETLGSDWYGN